MDLLQLLEAEPGGRGRQGPGPRRTHGHRLDQPVST